MSVEYGQDLDPKIILTTKTDAMSHGKVHKLIEKH
jgi:hypothetical protein